MPLQFPLMETCKVCGVSNYNLRFDADYVSAGPILKRAENVQLAAHHAKYTNLADHHLTYAAGAEAEKRAENTNLAAHHAKYTNLADHHVTYAAGAEVEKRAEDTKLLAHHEKYANLADHHLTYAAGAEAEKWVPKYVLDLFLSLGSVTAGDGLDQQGRCRRLVFMYCFVVRTRVVCSSSVFNVTLTCHQHSYSTEADV